MEAKTGICLAVSGAFVGLLRWVPRFIGLLFEGRGFPFGDAMGWRDHIRAREPNNLTAFLFGIVSPFSSRNRLLLGLLGVFPRRRGIERNQRQLQAIDGTQFLNEPRH